MSIEKNEAHSSTHETEPNYVTGEQVTERKRKEKDGETKMVP